MNTHSWRYGAICVENPLLCRSIRQFALDKDWDSLQVGFLCICLGLPSGIPCLTLLYLHSELRHTQAELRDTFTVDIPWLEIIYVDSYRGYNIYWYCRKVSLIPRWKYLKIVTDIKWWENKCRRTWRYTCNVFHQITHFMTGYIHTITCILIEE